MVDASRSSGRDRDAAAPEPIEANGPTSKYQWALVSLGCVALPAVLFVLIWPDWYFIQNGLDPFFYTAYVQNFTEIFHAVGDRHYFISRWTIYLPQRILLALTGDPTAAYILFRWVMATAVVAALFGFLGRRHRWQDKTALAALVLILPMTVRAFLTDYSDIVVFPLGVVMLVLVARLPRSQGSLFLAGACLGAMVVANPFGLTIALAAVPAWYRRVGRSQFFRLSAVAAAGAAVVVVGGLLFFRWRYGLPNVYQPTLDFISTRSGEKDALKSPRLWWLGYRLWIFMPLVVIAAYHFLRRRRAVWFSEHEQAIMTTCTIQYGFQIWFQFSRHGSTLEIVYYWLYMLPVLAVAIVVLLAALARLSKPWTLSAIVAGVLAVVVLLGERMPEVFQSWIDGLLVVGGLAAWMWRAKHLRPGMFASCVVVVLLASQVGAPRPEPVLPGELRVEAAYDQVYIGDESAGVASFKAVTWFIDEMADVPSPVIRTATFWSSGPFGARMIATFGAQVSGHWLNPSLTDNDASTPLNQNVLNAISAGNIPTLIAVGSTADAEAMSGQFLAADSQMRVVYRGVSPFVPDTLVVVVSRIPSSP